MFVDQRSFHWMEAAQSYKIVSCGAGEGEVHDYAGPACKTLEECINHVKQAESQERMNKLEDEYRKSPNGGRGLVAKLGKRAKQLGVGWQPSSVDHILADREKQKEAAVAATVAEAER